MTNTIAAAMIAGNLFWTNNIQCTFTNQIETPVATFSHSNKTLTIRDNYTNRLFIGTNEFRIVRTTNVVITVEPKKD